MKKDFLRDYNYEFGYESGKYISFWEILITVVVAVVSTLFLFKDGFKLLFLDKKYVQAILVSGFPTLLLLESLMLKKRDKSKKMWLVCLVASILAHIAYIAIIVRNSPYTSYWLIVFIALNDGIMFLVRLIVNAIGTKKYETSDFKKGGPLELILEGLLLWSLILVVVAILVILAIGILGMLSGNDTTSSGNNSTSYKSKEYTVYDEMSKLIDAGEKFELKYVSEGTATRYPAIAKFKYQEFNCEYDYVNKRVRTPSGIEYEYVYLGPNSFKIGKRVNKLWTD